MEQNQDYIEQRLFLLLMLYLRDTTILYIPQFEPLMHVAYWLDLISEEELEKGGETYKLEHKGIAIPLTVGLDICASCLDIKGQSKGGRVRNRCEKCLTYKVADMFFYNPWPNRIAQITGYSPEYIEYVMTKALKIYKYVRESHT